MSISSILYSKRVQYWFAQVLGWAGYFVLVYFSNGGTSRNDGFPELLVALFVTNILITHFWRYWIIKFDWFTFKASGVLLRVAISCFLLAALEQFIDLGLSDVLLDQNPEKIKKSKEGFNYGDFLLGVIITSIFFFLWSAIYFVYHYIGKSRAEEIKNIQLEASKTEIELKNLKAQLNPHFMFNSMNSIRALVDENPVQAKYAVTQLSSILRNTLLMGKSKIVAIKDELAVVKDYLSLEGIRYEERLRVNYHIDETLMACEIPPMMMQTLVENAIKHGISKLPNGGELDITIREADDKVEVLIVNTGSIQSENPEIGIGLRNTIKRLDLLYGPEGEFRIMSEKDTVTARFIYPKKKMI